MCDTRAHLHNSPQTIEECIQKLDENECVTTAIPSPYTVLELDKQHFIQNIHLRNFSYLDFGPECFKLNLLRKIFTFSKRDEGYTNFTAFVKANNLSPIFVVESNRENIKLTYPEDLYLIRHYLEKDCHK